MALPYQETMETLQKMFQSLNRETIATVLLNNGQKHQKNNRIIIILIFPPLEGMIDPSVEQLLKLSEAQIDPLADQK